MHLSRACIGFTAATIVAFIPAADVTTVDEDFIAIKAAAAIAAPPAEKTEKGNKPPKTEETAPATAPVSKPRYRAVLRLLDDTCPFNDFRETRYLDIDPFNYGSGFFVPLHAFGSIFTAPVTLQGPSTLSSSGGGLFYSGPVGVNVTMMPSQVPGEITGTLSADLSQFNARFRVSGYCSISGTIEGQRL